MKEKQSIQTNIHILKDLVAKKIAAGEVIERPASVVRELIDNSIDAQANFIEVYLTRGGLDQIIVYDNGQGMSPEDLKLCFQAHATSKITTIEDLDHLKTMGFRGEALTSMGVCAKLKVESIFEGSSNAYCLKVQEGSQIALEKNNLSKGTRVSVEDLFFSLPARKKFLKASSTESAMVRRALEEKAYAFPHITFKLYYDGHLKLLLNQESLLDRFLRIQALHPYQDQFYSHKAQFDHYSITLVMGQPTQNRRDRRGIFCFVNQHCVNEFTLMQAIEQGYSEFLPKGLWPVCGLWIEIDPAEVDFNVHPTKKEIKMNKLPLIHKDIYTSIQKILHTRYKPQLKIIHTEGQQILSQNQTNSQTGKKADSFPLQTPEVQTPTLNELDGDYFSPLEEQVLSPQEVNVSSSQTKAHFYGQIMGLFLIVEHNNVLFLVDQHAGHERILYDRFVSGHFSVQHLLVPYQINCGEQEAQILREQLAIYKQVGIVIKEKKPQEFFITSVPSELITMGEGLIDLVQNQKASAATLKRALYADMACKAAIKDGDLIQNHFAIELIKQVFALDNPTCPHGRPVCIRFTKTALFKQFKRIV